MDLDQSLERIKSAGFAVKDGNQILIEISKINNVPLQQVYLAMKPEVKDSKSQVVSAGKAIQLPDSPPPGTGSMTLAGLCAQFNLNIKTLLRDMSGTEIKADESQIIKKTSRSLVAGVSQKPCVYL